MRRRDALQLVAGAAGAAALPSCTKVATESGAQGSRRGTTIPHVLRYADSQDPVGLNPVVATHASTSWLAMLWAAWLFRYDQNYNPVPELCTTVPTVENGLLSRDGSRIVFKLREAQWADGTPFTSRDVAFSVATILNPNTNVTSREGWDKIARVETPDPHTAIFHMKELYAAFLPTFFTTGGANPCILPEHICKGQDPNHGPYSSMPVGTGPFMVTSWERAQRVVLVRNPKYWRGQAKLERIEYKIIPNADTMVTQLRTHELDMWVSMNPNYLNQVTGIPGTTVTRQISQYWRHFDCNCAHPITGDLTVRQALNYAIDRETMIRKALHGVGEINWTVLSPSSYAFNPSVKRYPFDIAKANSLLEGAGWQMGSNGMRQKNGVPLHLNFAFISGDPAWAQIVELVRTTWRQIGVTFDSKTYLSNLYFEQYQNGGIVNTGKFDVCAFSWGNTPSPTDMINLYASDQIPPHGQNNLFYRNSQLTQMLHAATRTINRSEQSTLLRAAQAIVAEQCPTFPLVQNVDLYPHNADLVNFHPVSNGPFDFMMNVDI